MKKISLVLTLIVGCGFVGCTDPSSGTGTPPDKKAGKGGKQADGPVAKKDGGKHEGWWCDEHGLPEEECWACSDKFCQQCKKEGDWCEKHERPKTQCFKCDPKLKDEWAKKYIARYGKKPPEPDDY